MTVKRARVVFAVLMHAAREGKHLTQYDKQQLSIARQVLRQIRKPVSNPSNRRTDWSKYTLIDIRNIINTIKKRYKDTGGNITHDENELLKELSEEFNRRVDKGIKKPIKNPISITMAEARQIAKKHGFTIKKTDYDEYRVCLIGGNEDSASYETDIDAAIGTGIAMAKYSVTRFPKGYAKNPKGKTLIYGCVNRIIATKIQKHICDAECKRHGHRYFHDFSSRPKMYGLPNGDLLITTR